LTIIHNKVDLIKIVSLVFLLETKQFDKHVFSRFHVLLISMLAHSHEGVCYIYYDLDPYAHDSNYFARSFTKLLQDLEIPSKSSFQQLFIGYALSSLIKALLQGMDVYKSSPLTFLQRTVPATPLPFILNAQMDIATSNNKNWFEFCY
jgi:hypothetical protein